MKDRGDRAVERHGGGGGAWRSGCSLLRYQNFTVLTSGASQTGVKRGVSPTVTRAGTATRTPRPRSFRASSERGRTPSLLTCHIRPVCGSRDGGTCGTMTAAPPRSAPLAIPMFFVVRAQFIPESARFNVSTGNTQAALATLQHIARMNRSALPEGRLVEPVLVSPGGRSPPRPGGHPGVPFVTGGQRDKGHYA